jgi:hypothetical protein
MVDEPVVPVIAASPATLAPVDPLVRAALAIGEDPVGVARGVERPQ